MISQFLMIELQPDLTSSFHFILFVLDGKELAKYLLVFFNCINGLLLDLLLDRGLSLIIGIQFRIIGILRFSSFIQNMNRFRSKSLVDIHRIQL